MREMSPALLQGEGTEGSVPPSGMQQPGVSWVRIRIKTQLENETWMGRTIVFPVLL